MTGDKGRLRFGGLVGVGNLVIADDPNHRVRAAAARTRHVLRAAMTADDVYTVGDADGWPRPTQDLPAAERYGR